jgi:hypothetical protein
VPHRASSFTPPPRFGDDDSNDDGGEEKESGVNHVASSLNRMYWDHHIGKETKKQLGPDGGGDHLDPVAVQGGVAMPLTSLYTIKEQTKRLL